MKPSFDQRIDRQANGCWLWLGARSGNGYGVATARRRVFFCHRLALAFEGIHVQRRELVLHSCDVKLCCNPAHLRVGTHKENSLDRVERQRDGWARGERNGAARLTATQVEEIRRLVGTGATHAVVGRQFGVAPTTVGAIARRNIWAHIGCAF